VLLRLSSLFFFFVVVCSQHFQDIQVDRQITSSSMQMLVNTNICKALPVTTFRLDSSWLALPCHVCPSHLFPSLVRLLLLRGILCDFNLSVLCVREQQTIFCVQQCMVMIWDSEKNMEILWKSLESDVRFYCKSHFRRSLLRLIYGVLARESREDAMRNIDLF